MKGEDMFKIRFFCLAGQIIFFLVWAFEVSQKKNSIIMWGSLILLFIFAISFRLNEERIENERVRTKRNIRKNREYGFK